MVLTVPKIKSFFQKNLDAMQRLLNKISTDEYDEEWWVDLEDLEIEEIHNLKPMEDGDTLQDNLE